MALNLEHLEKLVAEWKSLQPLQAPLEKRLWQKLQLLWNYHSNHIEGNTLTYGETAAYLLHGQMTGSHSEREYAEMKGHNLAIELVRKLAADPQDLTEVDIRNFNQIILKEPFYKEAVTPEGKETRKLITPGRYKEEPNSVQTSTGALFEYVAPFDVAARMAKLMEAIRNCTGKDGLAFMAALAITHHEFTTIHPFDDGNGRVARLVTNYILLKKGLPPLVINSDRKKDYLAALRQADGNDPAMLADFFAELLIWSLDLGIKAAKGESLEEPSDIEKEIELFVREQKGNKKQILKNRLEVVQQFLTTDIRSFGEIFDEKTNKLDALFESRELGLSVGGNYGDGTWQAGFRVSDAIRIDRVPSEAQLRVSLQDYLGSAPCPFGIEQSILVHLNETAFTIEYYNSEVYRASYADGLPTQKAEEIISGFLKQLLQQIKQLAQQ